MTEDKLHRFLEGYYFLYWHNAYPATEICQFKLSKSIKNRKQLDQINKLKDTQERIGKSELKFCPQITTEEQRQVHLWTR